MRAQAATQGNPALEIIPPIRLSAPWRVAKVEVVGPFRLGVTFLDGVSGIVDMAELVHSPDAGVFAALADPDVFAQAFVMYGAVTWPGELDLAPDAMYDEIRAKGEWVLR
jgi:hypothetical protein